MATARPKRRFAIFGRRFNHPQLTASACFPSGVGIFCVHWHRRRLFCQRGHLDVPGRDLLLFSCPVHHRGGGQVTDQFAERYCGTGARGRMLFVHFCRFGRFGNVLQFGARGTDNEMQTAG